MVWLPLALFIAPAEAVAAAYAGLASGRLAGDGNVLTVAVGFVTVAAFNALVAALLKRKK